MKNILVTGGAGYIGTYVVNLLLNRGYKVVVLDNLYYGEIGLNTFIEHENCQFIKGDISNESDVIDALKNVDGVIALAAIVGDPACNVNKELTYKINYEANKLLLKHCLAVDIQRLVFASSCSVYGSNNTKQLKENSDLAPVSLYAETRILSEKLFIEQSHVLSSVILRLSTIYGYSPRMRFDLAINIMTGKAALNEPVEIFGGNQWRPFLHVADAANAFVMALEAPDNKVRGQIFNVGSNRSNYQIKNIGEIIHGVIPVANIRQSSLINDQRDYNVSFDKIKEILNFEPQYKIDTSIREIYYKIVEGKTDIYDDVFHNVNVWKNIDSNRFIPFAVPDVGTDEEEEILDTIKSGWLSTGPKTKKFEDALCEYFNTENLNCIPVSSCTAGLHLQLLGFGVGKGDEVITTPLTFAATVHTIMQVGAKPVLVDIDRNTYNIDINEVEKVITCKTKAIVPVYYGGNPFDFDALYGIAERHNLLILADAAHAIGAEFKGKKIGTFEHSAAFSFYATKNLTTGEGGLVTTKDTNVAEKIKKMLSFGMNKNAWKRYSDTGSWYYEVSEQGFKYNFTDIQASFGLHQLKKIDEFNNIRNEFCQLYDNLFKNIEELIVPPVFDQGYSTRHLYPLLLKTEKLKINRNQFIDLLRKSNIGVSVHYVPINYHPYFKKKIGVNENDFKNISWFFDREISLPIYTKLSKDQIIRIAEQVKSIIKGNS